ncbi:MAG: dihydrolipoyl dehydrogenase [Leptospirillia bacterium]
MENIIEKSEEWDLVVLGAGSAGYVGAIRAAEIGMKVLVLDPGDLGGTCLHQGCIPTKVLLEAGKRLRLGDEGQETGIAYSRPTLDAVRLNSFRKTTVDRLFRGIGFLFKNHGVTYRKSRGRLDGPGHVLEEGKSPVRHRARNILLATGSKPRTLPSLPFDGTLVLSSTDLVRREIFEGRFAIVGGGAIGCEFAEILSAFGCETTILERESRLLPTEDPELGAAMEKELSQKSVAIKTGVEDLSLVRRPGEAHERGSLSGRTGNDAFSLDVDAVLVAVGRAPMAENLGLDSVGLSPGPGGFLDVDPLGKTKVPGIYAAGDLVGGLLLAHKASRQAVIAVETMAGLTPSSYDPMLIPRVVYTHPEVVSIGLTREEAEKKGYSSREGRFPLLANGRSLSMGQRRGFIKVVVEVGTKRVLGMHGIGPHLSEMMGGMALAMGLPDGLFRLSETVFPHPTVSEAFHEAVLEGLLATEPPSGPSPEKRGG